MDQSTAMGISIVVVILAVIVSLLVAIGLFFLFRAITCWYFKINKLLKEQQKTNAYLERIANAVERGASVPASFTAAPIVNKVPVAPPVVQSIPVPQPAPVVHNEPVQTPPEITVAPEVSQKTCAGCGVLLPADAAFCTQCGTPAGN